MSGFILRRYGRNFKAGGLKVLVEWIKEGRVLPTDLIFVEADESWRQATEIKAIEPYFPQGKDYPPTKLPPRVFWVKRRGAKVPAEGEKTLVEWAENGNLSPKDLVFHPALRQWFVAGDSPRLVKHMPAHQKGFEALVPHVEDPFAGVDGVTDAPAAIAPVAEVASQSGRVADAERSTLPDIDPAAGEYGGNDTDSEQPRLMMEAAKRSKSGRKGDEGEEGENISDSTVAMEVSEEELESGFEDTMAGEEVLVTHNELARVTLPGGIGAILPDKDPTD